MKQASLLPFQDGAEPPPSLQGSIKLLRPADVLTTLRTLRHDVATTILDPWYNKGIGGRELNYETWLTSVVRAAAARSTHVFVWGFPEIIHCVLSDLPPGYELASWLTWYYKNCPSVIRGWRSAQNACLHLARIGAPLYHDHFLNEAQQRLRDQGKLRYIPGPPNVIEAPLLVGFVGRAQQTGHPAQKPAAVFEPLILMTTKPGDTVLDPMCGSGTTGVACRSLGRKAILCDKSADYVRMTALRLGLDPPSVKLRRRSPSERGRSPSSPSGKPPAQSRKH